jgi:hypothetical protein
MRRDERAVLSVMPQEGAPLIPGVSSAERPASGTTSVATRMTFAASAEEVWSRLMFYEQIEARPPLLLRLLLPVPLGTVGRKAAVGDEARCRYAGGHLTKRVTRVEPGRYLAFAVAEQALTVRGGIQLAGGEFRLRELAQDRTRVTLATRYVSSRRPRWFWRPVEAAVCHSFHRHILRAMRGTLESLRPPERTACTSSCRRSG